MTRSSSDKLFEFDPEIEGTFHQRRTRASTLVGSSSFVKPIVEFSDSKVNIDDNNIVINAVENANANANAHIVDPAMTIKELVSPYLYFQNWCINYPYINANFELKSEIGRAHV